MKTGPPNKSSAKDSGIYRAFLQNESSLKRFLRRFLYRQEDIDDISQETFLRAYKAMIPQAAGGANGSAGGLYRYFGTRIGGATSLISAIGWFHQTGSKYYLKYPKDIDRETLLKMDAVGNTLPGGEFPSGDFAEAAKVLPLSAIPQHLGSLPNDFADLVGRELNDPWWQQFDYIDDQASFNTPALHVNSWYDGPLGATLQQWRQFQANGNSQLARDHQFLILSPTDHCGSERIEGPLTVVGERELGDARFPYWDTYLNWYAYWLKGEKNAITQIPKVQYYLMGANQWQSADTWPPADTRVQRYYLHSGGKANSRVGDGVLSTEPPNAEAVDGYTYDPAIPTPSRGGAMCCTGSKLSGAFDQSDIEMRNDMLVYTSPTLEKTVTVTGDIQVKLWVSSDAKDTDFVAKLIDVYPDGRAFNIQEGILRARYRQGFDKKVFMEKGEVYPITIDLQATANAFLPGHKIRLEISSSNFPAYDRNLNTGGDNFTETEWVVARNKVHHGGGYPSYVELMVRE
jgi:putative CocE/NonD family hydrolase